MHLRFVQTNQVIGVATSEVRKPNPDVINVVKAVELSYWHRKMESAQQAVSVGKAVVKKLLQINEVSYGTEPYVELVQSWMVTLPDDEIKSEVCSAVGMQPVGEPQRYDIEDGVVEPRQLWTVS